MNPQRSRSRERVQNPSIDRLHQTSGQQQHRKYEIGGFQKGPSNERHLPERSSSNPSQFQPQTFTPSQASQYRKSSSPNRMMQPESTLPPYPKTQNMYPNSLTRPTMMKEPGMSKIDKIEDLATWLRGAKKPFPPSQAINLQSLLQRLAPKYPFEQIYQTFVYFFIHSSTLDQNIYKVFYSLISNNAMAEGLTQDYLPRFYDTLIRATLKSSFEEFKNRAELIDGVTVSDYFRLPPLVREKVMGSLYQVNENPVGCSIRNTLTLVRKVMQREKNSDKNADSIHPIRQVLKVLKNIIKSTMWRIFAQQQQKQSPKLNEQSKQVEKVLQMILISQLSLIVHFKYRHHINTEFEETLNEMTILKMSMGEVEQQMEVQRKNLSLEQDTHTGREKYELMINSMRTNLEGLKKEHQKNYLYMLFVLNLSCYYSSESEEYDLGMFGFYARPLLEECNRSSDFLLEKVSQTANCPEKRHLFSNIIMNFGIYDDNLKRVSETNGLLARFITVSRFNILLKCVQYATEQNHETQSNSNAPRKDKFIELFNALSPVNTTFSKINQKFTVKQELQIFINAGHIDYEQQAFNHVDKEFGYLIDGEFKLFKGSINQLEQEIMQLMNKTIKYKIKFEPLTQEPNKQRRIIDLDKEVQTKKIHRIKNLKGIREWLTSLLSYFNSQTYIWLLALVFILMKQKKWQQAKKQLSNMNSLIHQIKTKESQNTDLIMVQQDYQKSVAGLKNSLKERLDKVVTEINNFSQSELLIIQLIQEQVQKSLSVRRNGQTIIKVIQKVLARDNRKYIKLSGLPSSILSIIVYELVSQQQKQQEIFWELVQKVNNASNSKANPQKQQNNIIEEKQQQSLPVVTHSQVDNLVEELISSIKKCIQLIKKSSFHKSSLPMIERNLVEKKYQLLKQQILTHQLPMVLRQVKSIHQTLSHSQVQSRRQIVFVQSLVEKLTLSLFKLRQEFCQSSLSLGQQQIGQNQNKVNEKENGVRNYCPKSIAVSFGLKPFIDQYTADQLSSSNSSKLFSHKTEQFLSNILQSIFFHFLSQNSPFQERIRPKTQQKQNILKLTPSLDEILVHKLKKCVSMYYDKINEHMINEFIINRELFILRVLVITFYKIKSLCEALIIKFGVFPDIGLIKANHQCHEKDQFLSKIFFNIKDERLLQPYMTFLMTKDKFYLKTQLVSLKQKDKNSSSGIESFLKML